LPTRNKKRTVQKTFISPNNNLSIYESVINRGIYSFNKDTIYDIEIIASDAHGNKSNLYIKAEGITTDLPQPNTIEFENTTLMNWRSENTYKNDDIEVVIPAESLYDTIFFNYFVSDPVKNSLSKTHHIHFESTPVHKKFSLSIKVEDLPSELSEKIFIAHISEDKSIESIGGRVVNDYIVAESKYFGNYTVLIDTVSPIIKPILQNNNLLQFDKIEFIIKDDLSGIKSYNGYIDNNWALFEYDLKNNILFYTPDIERIKKNTEHEVELFVTDNNGNIATYYTTFFW